MEEIPCWREMSFQVAVAVGKDDWGRHPLIALGRLQQLATNFFRGYVYERMRSMMKTTAMRCREFALGKEAQGIMLHDGRL